LLNAPVTFFIAAYFKRELVSAVDNSGPSLRHVVIDLLPVSSIDATGLMTVAEVPTELGARGISLNAAGRATEWRQWADKRGLGGRMVRFFLTLRQAVLSFQMRERREPDGEHHYGQSMARPVLAHRDR
jgi:MFS superfamily sulfate permease-like transporter